MLSDPSATLMRDGSPACLVERGLVVVFDAELGACAHENGGDVRIEILRHAREQMVRGLVVQRACNAMRREKRIGDG